MSFIHLDIAYLPSKNMKEAKTTRQTRALSPLRIINLKLPKGIYPEGIPLRDLRGSVAISHLGLHAVSTTFGAPLAPFLSLPEHLSMVSLHQGIGTTDGNFFLPEGV